MLLKYTIQQNWKNATKGETDSAMHKRKRTCRITIPKAAIRLEVITQAWSTALLEGIGLAFWAAGLREVSNLSFWTNLSSDKSPNASGPSLLDFFNDFFAKEHVLYLLPMK